jgi:hypothetical protein
MSQENLDRIARLYDEFLSRPERVADPAILQFFDPAVEVRQSASIIGTEETFHGYDGLARRRCSRRSGTSAGCPYGSSTAAIKSWPPLNHAATAGTATWKSR